MKSAREKRCCRLNRPIWSHWFKFNRNATYVTNPDSQKKGKHLNFQKFEI